MRRKEELDDVRVEFQVRRERNYEERVSESRRMSNMWREIT